MEKEQSCSEWQFGTTADLTFVVRKEAPQKSQMWFSKSSRTPVSSKLGVFLPFIQRISHVYRAMQKWCLGIADPPTMYAWQKKQTLCFNKAKVFKGQVLHGVHLKIREKPLNCGVSWQWSKSEVTFYNFIQRKTKKTKHYFSFNITVNAQFCVKSHQLSLLCTAIVPCVCGFRLGGTGCGFQVNGHCEKKASVII